MKERQDRGVSGCWRRLDVNCGERLEVVRPCPWGVTLKQVISGT